MSRNEPSAKRLDDVHDITEMAAEDFEDESLDSDEAFNDEDEQLFGDVINSIRSRKQSNSLASANESETESNEDDENESDEEEGVLLSDLLQNKVKVDAAKQAREELQRRKLVSTVIKEGKKLATNIERTETTAESEFNAVPHLLQSTSGERTGLSLSDLVSTMKQDGQTTRLKTQLQKLVNGKEKSLVEPVAPIVAARMERRVAYDDQTVQVGLDFQSKIQRNRALQNESFRGPRCVDMNIDTVWTVVPSHVFPCR